MSSVTTYTSRKGLIPCGDKDLYMFLTDMRNFGSFIPEGTVSDWQADEDKCSFKANKTGRVTAQLSEALPFTHITYIADTFISGMVTVDMYVDSIDYNHSEITIAFSAHLNPFLKIMIGDLADKYLEDLITLVENYNGYDKIRGYTQSL